MPYNEILIYPMRQDLVKLGVEETRTPADVDRAIAENETVLVVVNSVCGCAAGKARPAVGLALQNEAKPAKAVTVFAGGDVEATNHLRATHLPMVPPSSPSFALFKGGKPVYVMHRHQIESRMAGDIAEDLKKAFNEHCTKVTA